MKILFVCMANICRSPALMATLRHMALQKKKDLTVDSCGIGWLHLGEPSDPRTFESAKKHGIVIEHRSQQFQDSYFDEFDLILAVEHYIVEQLKLRAKTPQQIAKVHLATAFSRRFPNQEIPDPYYMSDSGFDEVMDIIIDACEGILQKYK